MDLASLGNPLKAIHGMIMPVNNNAIMFGSINLVENAPSKSMEIKILTQKLQLLYVIPEKFYY
jgi:hypothetical protein